MDGAGKFVRGDAIAGVVILLVNISGGLFLGVFNHHMSLGEAVNVFTKLTIGDGLVSQVPAFLISLAAGLIVTRSSSSTDLGRDVVGQLFWNRGVLGTAAVFLGLLLFTPLAQDSPARPGRWAWDRCIVLEYARRRRWHTGARNQADEPATRSASRGQAAAPMRASEPRTTEPAGLTERGTAGGRLPGRPRVRSARRWRHRPRAWTTCSTSIRWSWRSAFA